MRAARGDRAPGDRGKGRAHDRSSARRVAGRDRRNVGAEPRAVLERDPVLRLRGAARSKRMNMHPHEELVRTFYSAFQRRDAEAMAACYHPEVEFSDEVFTSLRGRRAGDMWRMLCARSKDFELEYRDVLA